MKRLLALLTLILSIPISQAQVFDVQPIMVSGNDDNRINIVILSDGYQTSELSGFIADATSFSNAMFAQSPFKEYADYFNVYAIKVPSNESGANHPGTATDVTEPKTPIKTVDNYFDTSFDSYGYHRLLYTSSFSKINNVLAANFPNYDQPLILVNSDIYGGAGAYFATSSVGSSANEIAIHEIGHSLFDLKDEYYQDDSYADEGINMTQETDPSLVKWKNWMGINGVGIYQHFTFGGDPKPWYRPHQNCKMRYLGVPFCSVCKEAMIEKIHDLVSPIDAYNPVSNTVENPSLPLEFQLNLIKPIPNTLESVWTLNAENLANNVDGVSLNENDLNEGENTLTATIYDATPFLRVDNHETSHIYAVSWTINYSTLGVKDIESSLNNYVISMYPNPANHTVNLKVESDNINKVLSVEIIGLDGRTVKTLELPNLKNQHIDIANFNQGIYLINFYSNKTLITTKKLVKN